MSQSASNEVTGQLVKLGFTMYQAKVYSSLVSLGVGGASEIYRRSRVPRTKVYEALEDLLRLGAAELQAGRPALYRAVSPKPLIARLVEDYTASANQVGEMLERQYREERSAEHDVAWTVKGDPAIRRKLVDITTRAKEEMLILETYPPSFTLSILKLLKAVAQRGVQVRAICLVLKDKMIGNFPESDFIEYRSFPTRSVPANGVSVSPDQDFLGPLSVTLASPYGLAVVDHSEAFVIVPNQGDNLASVGLSAKIPGVPLLLTIMFQQFLTAKTRKVRS